MKGYIDKGAQLSGCGTLGWMGDLPRYALGLTKDGHPKHPLYLPKDAQPARFRP